MRGENGLIRFGTASGGTEYGLVLFPPSRPAQVSQTPSTQNEHHVKQYARLLKGCKTSEADEGDHEVDQE